MRRIFTLLALFCVALLQAGVVTTMEPLTTKRPYLPRKKAGYAFISNIEQIAYTAYAHPTCIHFMPINASRKPVFYLALPKSIRLDGVFRWIDLNASGTWEHEGKVFNLYVATPRPNASKYTFLWTLTENLPEKTHLTGYYWGKYDKGEQEPQKLDIEVVAIPDAKPLRRMPVYWSMPGDFFKMMPEMKSLKASGINAIDIWTYLNPDERAFGESNLDSIRPKSSEAGLTEIGWIQEWWWHKGRTTEDGQALMADGTRTAEQLCPSYRGEWFQKLVESGKILLDRGIYFHSTDPEMYSKGDELCLCPRCTEAFKKHLAKTKIPFVPLKTLAASPKEHPAQAAAWADFKSEQYASFFRDYRKAMEAHLKSKGLAPKLFKFMIYSSYHRSYTGFYDHPDNYRECPIYSRALEDPAKLADIFDYIAPMSYTEVFANYKPYDMLMTWKDTVSLRRIMGDRTAVAPILSTGYPYFYAFDCDINAEMLHYVILEAIAGGARGFGFWGECPLDANDQKTIAQTVNMLAPAEEIIMEGRPDDTLAKAENAMVKCVSGPKGSLLLVSEYSRNPLTISVSVSPTLKGKVKELPSGRVIATLDGKKSTFSVTLEERCRAKLFTITK